MKSIDKSLDLVCIIAVFCYLISLWVAPLSSACPCKELSSNESVAEQPNVSSGLAYMKSPLYRREILQAVAEAKNDCLRHIGEDKVAIVSDIDETCLDNRVFFQENPDGEISKWHSWISRAEDPVLKPVAEFLGWARKNGFAVFFVTGRTESQRAVTIKNLVKVGLSYDGLYMRPDADKSPAVVMKPKFRKEISDMGFKVVLSIGDQYSDLMGGYAENCVKLPNRIYQIK